MKKGLLVLMGLSGVVSAGAPVWTFTPLTATTISLPTNDTTTVQYTVTNQSKKTHTLVMNGIQGITQDTSGSYCKIPFILGYQQSCILKLNITGSQLSGNVSGGPAVCEQASGGLQCYQPSLANQLDISLTNPITTASITVTGSPLTLTSNGAPGTLTVNNTSSDLDATNVTAEIAGTALEGNIQVNDTNCSSIPANGSCTLGFTPLSTPVTLTSFNIRGTNTNTVSASITIQPGISLSTVSPLLGSAAGGLGVTLTGTGLSDTTGITFDGVPASSVYARSSTSVTAVTPAHAVGAVDVVITTTTDSATKISGFTYQATTIGQAAYGGKIACLNGGLNNLIAAKTDNSPGIQWGGFGTTTGASSPTNGASNTTNIVDTLHAGIYAALLCSNYAIDSQGNTPCQTGNTCYNDWFLPAADQLNCLYTNKVAIGGFASSFYWTSTEMDNNSALSQNFSDGIQNLDNKNNLLRVRCVREFSP